MSTAEPIFDPRLPEFHANPYPFYHALREKDPVHQSPIGFWVLTRYDDVVTSLRDPRYGRDGFAPIDRSRLWTPRTAEGNLPRSMLIARSARSHPLARARKQGVHAAGDRGDARAHPGDRGQAAGQGTRAPAQWMSLTISHIRCP